MGCVGFSLKYFPRGRIEKQGMKAAELAARKELEAIVRQYKKTGWEEAVGSSGTAKALADIIELNGLSGTEEGGITRDGLERLRGVLLHSGDVGKLTLQGLRPDRIPVLPGGLAIMLAVFKEFGLERMTFSDGALRLGVLYDLLGRYHHQDLRNATVQQLMRRYQVDAGQAARVAATARAFYLQLDGAAGAEDQPDAQVLDWAARLHEIGISVAHSSYHKHSAYILANADMPGFSRRDQALLARLVLAHRGKLERVQSLTRQVEESPEWLLIFSLRLAALLHRARDDTPLPPLSVRRNGQGFGIGVDPHWLAASPLTASALEEEGRQWSALGREIRIKAGRGKSEAAA